MTRLTIVCISFIVISLMFTGQSFARIDPSTCVGMWLFDEDADDSSENNNHGTLMGNPEWVDGQFDEALEFDAAGDYVDCGDNASLQLANETFSWSFWLKRDAIGSQQLIIGQGVGAQNQGLVIGFRGSSVLTFAFWSNDLDTGAAYTQTDWHHWAGTYNASDKSRKIYRDGIEVASGTATANYQGSGILCIAGGCGGWAGSHLTGVIDEVAIFNITLAANDVQTIMDDGLEKATGMTAVSPSGKLATTWGRIKK